MDKLPQELIDRISNHLSRVELKNTLLLSHAFRYSAEKYSGAFTRFALTERTAETFITTFSGHRLKYLRDLQFATRLPLPEDSRRRDNAEQLSKNDKSFTEQIMFLFKTVEVVEKRAGLENRGMIRLSMNSPLRPIFLGYPLSFHDHLSWRVHLLDPDALPSLESVRSLEVGDDWPWDGTTGFGADHADYDWARVKLDYRAMVDIVVKLPNLEYWGCRVGGDEWSPEQEATRHFTQDWAGPRRDTRHDFAKALMSARLPSSLRRIRLDFLHDLDTSTQIDHLTPQPNLVHPAAKDPFSTSLHYLSQYLRRLHLRVVADETLFWPLTRGTPSWPNLQSFVILFHIVSPSGRWYFIGPSGEGRNTGTFKVTDASYPPLHTTDHDEEMMAQIEDEGDRRYRGSPSRRVRIVPNDTLLRPFLAAFAKAASNMRALQEAVLWCPLTWAPNDEDLETDLLPANCPDAQTLGWGIHYQAIGEPDFTRQGKRLPTEVPLLWWKVGKWRPDPELHQLFQQIGSTTWGPTPREHWVDQEYGEGLVDREYFEYCVQEEVDQVGRIPPPN